MAAKKQSYKSSSKASFKNGYLFGALAILLIACLILGGWVTRLKETPAAADFPTFMDAGAVSVTAGDFKYANQPKLGSDEAPVKMIEFADFKCPACKDWYVKNMSKFRQEFIDTGKVQLYFINFPFLGPDSILAASAAEAIYHQSEEAFWKFEGLMFERQADESRIWATADFLADLVKDHLPEIDAKQFKHDLENNTYLLDAKEDFKITTLNGVNGTPTFFVNGVKTADSGYETVAAAINAAAEAN